MVGHNHMIVTVVVKWNSEVICYCFATTRMGPRNKTHVTSSSYVWFIFNLNTK
jgi:hypothetical protein